MSAMRRLITGGALAALPLGASAATLDGATLSALWGMPFAGVLLSIAVFPLVAPAFWHHHFGKIVGWRGRSRFSCRSRSAFGAGAAFGALVHAMLEEYMPFIVLLTALYTVAGGICVRGNLHGSPRLNTAISRSARCSRASWARPAPRCC